MVTSTNRPTNQQGEYRAICLFRELENRKKAEICNIPDTFLGDEMHNSQLELSTKRVELNVCESFKYFTEELLCKYLEKLFVILKVRFHHEGGLSESRYFELFFSTRYETHPHKKSAFTEPPFLLFLTFGIISSNFVF